MIQNTSQPNWQKEYDYCMVFEAAGVHDEVVVGRKGVGTFFHRY